MKILRTSASTRILIFLPIWAWSVCCHAQDTTTATSAAAPAAAELPATGWDAHVMGDFVFCLEQDAHGVFWAGTEGRGVWRFDPAAPPDKRWKQFTMHDGLAEDDVLSLRRDRAGRIWAGHASRGVSVFDGRAWRAYTIADGPLGGRVYDIEVDPAGNVWLATDAGIAIYRAATDRWHYLTTRNGLPANQIQALAFDAAGRVYIGMQTDGIVVGEWDAAAGFTLRRHTRGPDRMPVVPRGPGLPSGLVNALLVARNGAVYAGTPDGLAVSRDQGASWKHWRGRNLPDKLTRRYVPPGERETLPPDGKYLYYIPAADDPGPVKGSIRRVPREVLAPGERDAIQAVRDSARRRLEPQLQLHEDWIACLTEDGSGKIWIGFRQRGCQVLDPATETCIAVPEPGAPAGTNITPAVDLFVRAILPMPGGAPVVALYGGGLVQARLPAPVRDLPAAATGAGFPTPATPPTAAELAALTEAVAASDNRLQPGAAVYLGEDWQTRGDWLGKYGQHHAEIFSHNFVDASVSLSLHHIAPYTVTFRTGPNGGGAFCYLPDYSEPHVSALYDPFIGCRAIAERNDGSFLSKYTLDHDGPDLWLTVDLQPKGVHRVGLYFCNYDGHGGRNRFRDYVAEVRQTDGENDAAAQHSPIIARGRIRDFYNGVYARFFLCGSHKYQIRIARNYSFVTKLQGVFIDKVSGSTIVHEFSPRLPGLADIYWGPIDTELLPRGSARDADLLTAADRLWKTLRDHADKMQAAAWDHEARALAYRAALAAGAQPEWLRAWRWQMGLWEDGDRQAFIGAMRSGWDSYTFEGKDDPRYKHRIWE